MWIKAHRCLVYINTPNLSMHHLLEHINQDITRNGVYETLCPQPLSCPPSCSPGILFTILLQLTKSRATSCNGFQDIFIGRFWCPNLQRALTQKMQSDNFKKKEIYFIDFHHVVYLLSSLSWLSLKLLAVTIFEISSFYVKIGKGQ